MANPDPEILPPEAKRVRPDVIVATGRTDYPNQVNNVLGFPSIFRGALDVRATTINEDMMIAAVKALAELAQEEVPEKVSSAYNNKKFHFGPDYIIPKPFDPRVIMRVAPAVAKAAMDSGVALKPIEDFQAYTESLEALQGFRQGFMRSVINRVKAKCAQKNWDLPRIVFPEGKSKKVLQAVHTLIEENVAYPILLGSENLIRKQIAKMDLDSLSSVEIIQPSHDERFDAYVEEFYRLRQRKGVMLAEAEQMMLDTYYFAAMMVRQGHADGLVSGASANYAKCVTPILSTIGTGKSRTASGLNIMIEKDRLLLLADTTMMIDPTAEQLATVAIHAAKIARFFDMEPRIAMLSYTNFRGETANPRKMAEAVQIVRRKFPHIKIDGEMQADTAVNPAIPARIFPFCELREGANILIFPNLDSGNIAYKLLQQLGGGEVIGPFLMGINRPAHIVQRTGTSEDVLNTAIITALQAVAYREMIRVTV
jgi:malate dehydrogenase (oxaloacetate-decarboxylating)(NADP+)